MIRIGGLGLVLIYLRDGIINWLSFNRTCLLAFRVLASRR